MGTNDGPTVADGGEPSYDHEMDRRLTVLETRFDTLLPTVHNDFMKWIIGLCISLFVAVIGFDIAILNAVNKATPAKQTAAAIAVKSSVPSPPSIGAAR